MIHFPTFSIKKLFFPETFDTYFNWSQRIVGIEITSSRVLATVLQARGSQRVIESFFDIPIPNVSKVIELETKDGQEKEAELVDPHYLGLLQALKELQQKIGPVDKVFCYVPLQQVIYKDVIMEMTDEEKIQKILPFELENTLPFSVSEAAFSGALLQKNIFTAVVSKQSTVDYYEKLFTDAGLSLDKLSTNSFELYALLVAAQKLQKTEQSMPVVLIHSNEQNSFLFIQTDKNQTVIKSIPSLMSNNELQKQHVASVAVFLRSAMQKNIALIPQLTVYLSGAVVDCPDCIALCAADLGVAHCVAIKAEEVIKGIATLGTSVEKISEKMVASMALALYLPLTMYCNVLDKKVQRQEDRLLNQQMITAIVLLSLIFLSLFGNGFLRKQYIAQYNARAEKEAIETLRSTFKLNPTKRASLDLIKNNAKEALSKQESIWYALSPSNRDSFLSYLQELSMHINRAELGLNLKKLSLQTTENPNQDILIMDGSVKDWAAARAFDAVWLEMPMVMEVPMTQTLKFSFTINLNKNYRKTS